ncbi:MAG: class I SAM-dependent methyltransferase [Bradymonadia bacterium]
MLNGYQGLACPVCGSAIEAAETPGAHCTGCGRFAPSEDGCLDMMSGVSLPPSGIGPQLMHVPPVAHIYEKYWRPAFVTATARGRISFEQELVLVERFLHLAEGGDVLDLSCGPGLFGRRLARSKRFETVYALDRSRVMLEKCRQHCADEGIDTLNLIWGDAQRLPFKDKSLAGVHAGFAIHLWEDPQAILDECVRVLAPGGVFVASTMLRPMGGKVGETVSKISRDLARVSLFTETELRSMCHRADLRRFYAVTRGGFIVFRAESGIA